MFCNQIINMQADCSPHNNHITSHPLQSIISQILESNRLNDLIELSRILKEEISSSGSKTAKNKEVSTPTPTPPSTQQTPLVIESTSLVKLTRLLLQDLQNSELCDAAVKAIGYLTHSATIVVNYKPHQVVGILIKLAELMTSTNSKGTCNLTVWCISIQSFPLYEILQFWDKSGGKSLDNCFDNSLTSTPKNGHSIIQILITALMSLIDLSPFQSTTIEHEAITALGRLLIQAPQYLVNSKGVPCPSLLWVPVLVKKLFSETSKVRDKADQVLRLSHAIFKTTTDALAQKLYEDIRNIYSQQLIKMLEVGNKELACKIWEHLIFFVGKLLFKGDLINAMLKIPEKTLLHESVAVRTASYSSWKVLIDNFGSLPEKGILVPKKLKLVMLPFLNCLNTEMDVGVRQTCYGAWIHLVQVIGHEDIDKVFEKVIVAVVDAMVKDSLENSNKSLDIRLQTIQAIEQLLGTQSTQSKPLPESSSAISTLPSSCVHSHLVYFLQIFDKCVTASLKDEYLLTACLELWKAFLQRCFGVESSKEKSKPKPLETKVIKSVLETVSKILVNPHQFTSKWILQLMDEVIENVPANILTSTSNLISIEWNITSRDQDDTLGKEVIPLVYLTSIWINLPYPKNSEQIENQTLVQDIIPAFSNQFRKIMGIIRKSNINVLSSTRIFIKLLESKNYESETELNFLLQLWMVIVEYLGEYMENTNNVFDKSLACDHDLNLGVITMMFPIRLLVNSSPMATSTDDSDGEDCGSLTSSVTTAFTKYFGIFMRILPLKYSEPNQFIYLLCVKIDTLLTSTITCIQSYIHGTDDMNVYSLHPSVLSTLSRIIGHFLGVVDQNSLVTKKRKMTGLSNNNSSIGTYTIHNLLVLVSNLLKTLHSSTQGAPTSNELVAASIDFLKSIQLFLANITTVNYSQAFEVIDELMTSWSITIWFEKIPSKSITASTTSPSQSHDKLKQAVFQLWDSLLECVARNYKGSFNSEFLQKILAILKCGLGNKHRHIKNTSLHFWNQSFGTLPKETPLDYPLSLLPTLNSLLKSKVQINLPGFHDISESPPVPENSTNSSKRKREPDEPKCSHNSTDDVTTIKGDELIDNLLESGASVSLNLDQITQPATEQIFASAMGSLRENIIKNKLNNEQSKKSNLSSPASTSKGSKKVKLDTTSDKEYVEVGGLPQAIQPLTEHQQEVMVQSRNNCKQLAEFSSLDQSQPLDFPTFKIPTKKEPESEHPKEEIQLKIIRDPEALVAANTPKCFAQSGLHQTGTFKVPQDPKSVEPFQKSDVVQSRQLTSETTMEDFIKEIKHHSSLDSEMEDLQPSSGMDLDLEKEFFATLGSFEKVLNGLDAKSLLKAQHKLCSLATFCNTLLHRRLEGKIANHIPTLTD